jgi:streptogramin lyase
MLEASDLEPVLSLSGFSICILVWSLLNLKSPGKLLVRRVARGAVGIVSVILLVGLLFTPVEATTITEYLVPGNPGLWDLSVNGTHVFFTEGAANNVGILFLNNNSVRQIPVPTLNSYPWGITLVPWTNASLPDPAIKVSAVFTEAYGNKIGVMASNLTRKIAEYEIPTPGASPRKIVYDKLRNCVWFTEYGVGKLGNFSFTTDAGAPSLYGGRFGEVLLPGANPQGTGDSHPIGLAIGTNLTLPLSTTASRQPYIWVADFSRKSIVRVHPERGECREYSVSPFSPWDVAVDPDGIVWFTAQVVGSDINVIGRLDPVAYEKDRWSITTFTIPTAGCEVHDIEIDQRGNVWFTEFSDTTSKIGKYVPLRNVFMEYSLVTPTAKPQGLAIYNETGGIVNVWFTEYAGRRIGRIRQPEGPTVSTTVSSITYAITTSSSLTNRTTWTGARSTFSRMVASHSTATATNTTVSTASSTIIDTMSIVLTSSTYFIASYTYTTATSLTTTTNTYKLTTVSTETTSTTTSSTVTVFSVSWQSVTVPTTTTLVSLSLLSETTSTTATVTQTSTVFSPTTSVPTTTTIALGTTIYSPTITVTSTSLAETSTTTTSSTTTTAIVYSPTVTVTSTSTTLTTALPLGALRPCVIASAAYGSELAAPVQFLREFRNEEVLSTFAGSQFMKAFNMFYYSFSPAVASMILQSPLLAQFVRTLVYPLIGSLEASSSIFRMLMFAPELGIVLAGIFGSALLGIVYLTPTVIAIRFLSRRIRLKRCGLQENSRMMGSKAR